MEVLKIEELGGEYISKEIIKRSKDTNIIYLTEDIVLNTKCVKQLAEYIKNLINRNKELENHISFYEKNDSYKSRIIELKEEIEELTENYNVLENIYITDTIPKSVIEEKIEYYKNLSKDYEKKKKYDFIGYWQQEFLKACHKYQALQELLEEQ